MNEYEVIANAQIIGRIALLCGRSKPWFWRSVYLSVVTAAIRGMALRLRAKRRWKPLPEAGREQWRDLDPATRRFAAPLLRMHSGARDAIAAANVRRQPTGKAVGRAKNSAPAVSGGGGLPR